MINRRDLWRKVQAAYPEANFLQSPEWGKMNELVGHKIVIEATDERTWCLAIRKDAKRGRYLEIPGGPLVDWKKEENF